MHSKYRISLFLLVILLIVSSCSSTDLAFINEVKTFEPRWMDLSEKFLYVKRNLQLTETRYQQDISQIEDQFEKVQAGRRTQLYTLRNEYRNMIEGRDKIQKEYESQYGDFTKTIYEFNEWGNKLMKNDLKSEQAKIRFIEFKEAYEMQLAEIDELQTTLIQNIELHNRLMSSMTSLLEIYTSYQIDPK